MMPPRSTRAIHKTLEITTDFAFNLLRKGKYRRASTVAHDALRQLPPKIRRSADAKFLRMIGASARHIADWYAADDRERRARRKRKRRPKAKPKSVLLLVPERPGAAVKDE